MLLTLQECIDKIKKEYPNHFPYTFVSIDGKYIFNLVQKGYDPKKAISDMHVVDPDTGFISGGISIMEFLKNPRFREAWKNPNLVSNHDESIGHSSFFVEGRSRGWGIRKIQNGSNFKNSRRTAVNEDEFTYGGVLIHHGIKGQKWGVRRFQNEDGSYTPEGKERYGRNKGSYNSDGGQRTGLIPELVSLAAIVGVELYLSNPKVQDRQKNKQQKKFTEKNRAISEDILGDIQDINKQFSDDNPPKMISGNHSIDDDLLACNPRYKNGVVPGTSNNCTLCAFTYDMRRRGYDVAALASESGNYPDQIIKDLYKDAKEDKFKARSFTDLFNQAAEKYPEGARGEVHLVGVFFAHSMAWEIKNHELIVMDPQQNARYTAQELQDYGFYPNDKENGFVRTDNLEVNLSGMNSICAEYKSDGLKTAKIEAAKVKALNGQQQAKNRSQNKSATGIDKISDSERRRNYEEAYLKEHPNADRNSKGLKNYVDAQMKAK